uniref:Uncharacterized protein n=1 Tax=Anguilla anguilla TaxID=7936 RepID=A0A0E9VIE4_ANGAN
MVRMWVLFLRYDSDTPE